MWNKCNVVMLSTEDAKAPILSYLNDKSIQYFPATIWSNSDLTKRHLYITSDEVIKEGDWFILNNCNPIQCVMKDFPQAKDVKKIIATTDTSLGIALISKEFINYFIEQYNKGNVIKEVWVEFKVISNDLSPVLHYNSKKIINIKPIKDSWSREEVTQLLHKYENDMLYYGRDGYYRSCFPKAIDDWANKNLY